MSREYAIGLSVKYDVSSFDVLVRKIISIVKNRLFSHLDHSLNLRKGKKIVFSTAWAKRNNFELQEPMNILVRTLRLNRSLNL